MSGTSLSLSLVCCRSLRSFSSSSCSSFSAEFLKRFSQSLNNSQQEAFEERIPKEKYNIDEEKLQKERRKAIGNVIFIGELFQVNLIAIKRVLLCIGDLIRQLDANLKQTSPNVFIFCLDKISMISLSSVLIFVVFFFSLLIMQFSCIVLSMWTFDVDVDFDILVIVRRLKIW
jgi:hypothetical protein